MGDRWYRGWEDGQRLVYNLALLERLDACYVPVPEIPAELLRGATSSTMPPPPVRTASTGE